MQKQWYIQRLHRILDIMKKNDIGNLILRDQFSLRYFTGIHIESEVHLIITAHSDNSNELGSLIVPALELERTKQLLTDLPIQVIQSKNRYKVTEVAEKLISKYHIGEKKIGLQFSYLSLSAFQDIYESFIKPLNKSKDCWFTLNPQMVMNIDEIMNQLRAIKDPDELNKIKKAAAITDFAMEVGIENLTPGKTEKEIAAQIEFEMLKKGADEKSFNTIIASGPNSWFPHAGATDRKLEEGDIVTIDMGATYEGYHADLTRTVFVGRGPYKPELIKIVNLVNQAEKMALDFIKEGVKCSDVDSIARNYFKQEGKDQYFNHGLGHGVGLDVHDKIPLLAQGIEYELKQGMIVTVEPGLYIPNLGGARTEDLILVTKDGYEKLSHAPIKWY